MNIQAIIVTYYPAIKNLAQMCSVLLKSKSGIIIVDNSERSVLDGFCSDNSNVIVLQLNENTGIAHAQNVGVHKALGLRADVIVFFDQDSKINENFISNLLIPMSDKSPIIVAPISFDAHKGFEYPSLKYNKWGLLKKVYCGEHIEPYNVDMVISSGSAATQEVFLIAGFMDEDFFIDFVDMEWVLRCRAKRIPVLVNPRAVMIHSIGNASVKIGPVRIFIHSPVRSYYKLRNAFLFFRKKNIPFLLRMKEIFTALFHQFWQLFYVSNKQEYIKSCFLAVFDGIMGVKGARNLEH